MEHAADGSLSPANQINFSRTFPFNLQKLPLLITHIITALHRVQLIFKSSQSFDRISPLWLGLTQKALESVQKQRAGPQQGVWLILTFPWKAINQGFRQMRHIEIRLIRWPLNSWTAACIRFHALSKGALKMSKQWATVEQGSLASLLKVLSLFTTSSFPQLGM